MKTHAYLRAFLAGTFVPALVLPLVLVVFVVARLDLHVPVPIEQAMIFPMALVPAAWALWNMLWVATHARTHLAIGLHGGLLPLLLMPAGAALATCLGVLHLGEHGATWFHACTVPYALIAPVFLCMLAGYYLLWKYAVGFLNRELDIE